MWIKNFFQKIYNWLRTLGSYLKGILIDAFDVALKEFIKKMGPTVEEILLEIQTDPAFVLNDDKRKEAFKRIMEEAKDNGITVLKENVIYVVMEVILRALKNRGDWPENAGE